MLVIFIIDTTQTAFVQNIIWFSNNLSNDILLVRNIVRQNNIWRIILPKGTVDTGLDTLGEFGFEAEKKLQIDFLLFDCSLIGVFEFSFISPLLNIIKHRLIKII